MNYLKFHSLKHRTNDSGFTLIELILYVALVSMMLVTLIPFAWNVIEGGVKVQVEQEVYSQARYVSEFMKAAIRDSSSVSSCSGTELGLLNSVTPANSVRFCYASNTLTFNQGNPPAPCPGAVANRLHSIDTKVNTPVLCTSFLGTNTDNVQINFTVASNYLSTTRNEYNENLTVQFSAETRE